MAQFMSLTCSICQKPVAERARNPAFPFCSLRCKTVDLGKWLGEEYRVVSDSVDAMEDEGQAAGKTYDSREDA